MPSNQFVLAYHSKTLLTRRELRLRMSEVESYVQDKHPGVGMRCTSTHGGHTGVMAWSPIEDPVGWPQISMRDDRAAAWVNIPEHDGLNGTTDPIDLAAEATSAGADISSFGAPFACMYWHAGNLTVVNDVLGLARLYQFSFGPLTVWATRPGLAHIFAAERLEKNNAAWAGMATLGWNLNGVSHIGAGKQLAGYTRSVAIPGQAVATSTEYGAWVGEAARTTGSWSGAATGIMKAMSVGRYFAKQPIADLSGGKDSRVLAAAALRSGVTTHVRTLRTDHGEVETAERLVALYDGPVDHEVREVAQPKNAKPLAPLQERLMQAQAGYEGSLLPVTAISGAPFKGFLPMQVARFNGHGGESLQGGALFGGAWRSKLNGEGFNGALNRMIGMISAPLATSEESRERSVQAVEDRLRAGEAFGINTAHGLLNYFYNSERMPFWSSSFSNRATLTPYYSSGLLDQIARTFWGETGFASFHGKILTDLVPAWADVPFYKPQGVTRRATKFFWENNDDWSIIRGRIEGSADTLPHYDSGSIIGLVQDVDSGKADKALEVALARFLWELSLDTVIDDLNDRVNSCRGALDNSSTLENRNLDASSR